MTNKFKEFIQKIGSGNHTSENLTRAEAATGTKMMWTPPELRMTRLRISTPL